MNILLVGDIVGAPGRRAFANVATRLRQQGRVEFVVANAENAAGGKGLTPPLADELLEAGADVLTLGDHAFDQREIIGYLPRQERVLRPANLHPACPGRGMVRFSAPSGPVTVLSLQGRTFMRPVDCPFRAADALIGKRTVQGPGEVILVEVHAEATSEKIVLGRYLDGRVSSVAGTHTHVQTSDERILPNGTAYITDLGMTGPRDSALGRDLESVTHMMTTGMPARFEVASGEAVLEGAIVRVDPKTGKARAIERIREIV